MFLFTKVCTYYLKHDEDEKEMEGDEEELDEDEEELDEGEEEMDEDEDEETKWNLVLVKGVASCQSPRPSSSIARGMDEGLAARIQKNA